MSSYPESLVAHLAHDVTTVCQCWRLTRSDGETTGYTDHDGVLTVDGTIYEPRSGFSASEARDGRLTVIGLKGFDLKAVEAALAGA